MQEKDQNERMRRLRDMLGGDCSRAPAEDVGRQTDQSDDAVEAIMTHPDGRVERLRMSRTSGEGGHGESSI